MPVPATETSDDTAAAGIGPDGAGAVTGTTSRTGTGTVPAGRVLGGVMARSGRPVVPARAGRRGVAALRSRPAARLVVAALLVGLALRVAIGATDDAPSTDETAYLRSGASLVAGDGFRRDGRPELHFPPLVPFLLGAGGQAFDDPHTATVVLTVLAGTATVVPLSLLARRLAGPGAGVATAWVAALAPALSTTLTNRGGGSEGVYALLIATGAWSAVDTAGRQGRAYLVRAAGTGAAVGLAYLTRPEGLFVGVPLFLAVVVPLARRAARRRADAPATDAPAPDARAPGLDGPAAGGRAGHGRGRWWAAGRAGLPAAVAFAVPVLACVVPYAAFLHSHTGTWQLSAKTNDASVEAWHAVARGDREARDSVLWALDEEGLGFAAGSSSLPSLAREDPGGYARIVATNARVLGRALVNPDRGALPAWQLLPAPLWLLACWGAWRMRRAPAMGVLVAVSALPVATALAFFVQPRYLIGTAALATVPVGIALAALPRRPAGRVVAGGAFGLLALSCVMAFHGGGGWWHPTDHTSQRAAGEWIAANAGPDDRLMARSFVVEYYADRPTIALPYADYDRILAFGRHYGATYLVLDANTTTRLRPQLSFLGTEDEAPGLRLVHEAEGEGGTARIFALDPPPPADAPPGPRLGFVGDGPA